MSCNQGNDTLDPYQNIIDGINKSVTTLENQASIVQPVIDEFDSISDAITTPTLPSALNTALNQFTAESICAASTDLQPINDLTSDCLNEATAAIKRYIKNISSNISDGILLLNDIVTLPEGALFSIFQKIIGLTTDMKDFITAIDNKIQCVLLSGDAELYQEQIDDLSDRMNTVTDNLRLSSDGSFDSDVFLGELSEDLKTNIQSYQTKAQNIESEIESSVSSAVNGGSTVNPSNYF